MRPRPWASGPEHVKITKGDDDEYLGIYARRGSRRAANAKTWGW